MPESAVAELTSSSTPAPSSTTSGTPTSAPATSATGTTPSSTTPASTRPTDVRSLASTLADLDKSTTPAVPPTTTAQPGGPTTQGAVTTTTQEPAQGPIPFDVHKTALENARVKATADWDRQYGWVKALPSNTWQEWRTTATRLAQDPVGFVADLATQLSAHPVYGPQIAARFGSEPAALATDKPQPDVEIRDEHGRIVGKTYSDGQLEQLNAWNRRQIADEMRQEFQPVLSDYEQRQNDSRIAEQQRALHTAADSQLSFASRILGMKSVDPAHPLWAKVHAAMTADPTLSVVNAAFSVRDAQGQQSAEAAVRDDMLRKANANTANPSGAVVPAARPTNLSELAERLRLLDGAAG